MSEISGQTISHSATPVGAREQAGHGTLLHKNEPAPFTLLNEGGSAPLLLACDHASNRLPVALNQLGVEPALLDRHIGYDIGTESMGRMLMDRFDAPLLIANYSRLAIDLNRHHNDPTLVPEVSDGHIIHGNQNLSEVERQARIDELFTPYHDTYHRLTLDLKSRFRRPLILSLHSFTPQIQGIERPWHFGVLWDQEKELAASLLENFRLASATHSPALVIGDNKPYDARVPLGYAMVKHAQQLEIEMALIETRQDLVVDEAGQKWAADIIYEVLSPLLDSTPAARNK